MMVCAVIGCENIAEYRKKYSGHCGDSTEVEVLVCKECYLAGWVYSSDKSEQEILNEAEKMTALLEATQ